jgi:hypothetical protein
MINAFACCATLEDIVDIGIYNAITGCKLMVENNKGGGPISKYSAVAHATAPHDEPLTRETQCRQTGRSPF